MTYIQEILDEICKGFCPMCEYCEMSHFCGDIMEIKKTIIKIMDCGEITND